MLPVAMALGLALVIAVLALVSVGPGGQDVALAAPLSNGPDPSVITATKVVSASEPVIPGDYVDYIITIYNPGSDTFSIAMADVVSPPEGLIEEWGKDRTVGTFGTGTFVGGTDQYTGTVDYGTGTYAGTYAFVDGLVLSGTLQGDTTVVLTVHSRVRDSFSCGDIVNTARFWAWDPTVEALNAFTLTGTVPVVCTPAAPTNLSATGVSRTQVDLTWQDNSVNEQGFKIERLDDTNGASQWTQIGTVGPSVNTYPDTGRTCETPYYYRVRAYNAAGDSAYSNMANGTTLACLYTVSGRIVDDQGQGIPDVNVIFSQTFGASASQVEASATDANGDFTQGNVPDGTYTVTPGKSGYMFSPTSRQVKVEGADVTGVDFLGTTQPMVFLPIILKQQ